MRIAVLGGGIGSLSAVWKLTDPALGGAHEVTVYQRDGLLGGKCASTRNRDPDRGDRIEEHGIHLLMGFYDQTFTLLDEVYSELAQNGFSKTLPFDQAFEEWDSISLSRFSGGQVDFQRIPFPPNDMTPGGSGSEPDHLAMFKNAFGWFSLLLTKLAGSVPLPFIARLKGIVWLGLNVLVWLMKLGVPMTGPLSITRGFIDRTLRGVWEAGATLITASNELRWIWIGLWLVGTNLRGMIEDGLVDPAPDWSSINDEDYAEWLKGHDPVGGSLPPELSWDSPAIRSIYDLVFSAGQPLCAGTVLHNLIRITLDYKGHLAFKMNAGMGETVFTPLYRALEARGVTFKFFHEVTSLVPEVDGTTGEKRVSKISFQKQEAVLGPYVPVSDTDVELADGSQHVIETWNHDPPALSNKMDFEILRGSDFDAVVLGIPVGALPGICQLLAAQDPALADTFGIESVSTQAVQLWLDEPLPQLGWIEGPVALSTFARPFNTWVDMTHTGRVEGWDVRPSAIAYFVNEFTGDPSASDPDDVVWQDLDHFAQDELLKLWPAFEFKKLKAPDGTLGIDRLKAQYWHASVDPSDRYVISKVGTDKLRIPADGTAFENLAVSGDWVRTPLDSGCFEAATMSGLAAADAIIEGRVTS